MKFWFSLNRRNDFSLKTIILLYLRHHFYYYEKSSEHFAMGRYSNSYFMYSLSAWAPARTAKI
jgi:hypothetical protein